MKRETLIGLTVLMLVSLSAMMLFGCASQPAPAPTSKATAPAASTPAAPQKVYKLKWATGEAQDSYISVHLVPAFKRMQERANGRLEITYYPSETLAKMNVMLDAVRKGVTDVGLIAPANWPEELNMNSVFGLPGLCPNGTGGTSWYNLLLDQYFQLEYAKAGAHAFAAFTIPPYNFYSPVKPLQKLDDLKGLLVRSLPGERAKIEEQLGATPIGVTGYEMFDALQKRTIDVGAQAPKWMFLDAKFLDLAKPGYYLDVGGFGAFPGTDIMNMEVWNSLPADLQRIIEQETQMAYVNSFDVYDSKTAGAIDAAKAKGVTVSYLNAADKAKLASLIKPAYDRWIAACEAKGLPGRQLFEKIQSLMSVWQKEGVM